MVNFVEKEYSETFEKINKPGKYEVNIYKISTKEDLSKGTKRITITLKNSKDEVYFVGLNIKK